MAGGLSKRAGLAPAGHPAVDQARIDRETVVRSEAEPLGDTGPKALDECVGAGDQLLDDANALGSLEIDSDSRAPTRQQVVRRRSGRQVVATGSVDPDHVGAQVREEHGGERCRTEPGQLDYPYAMQRPGRHGPIVTAALSRSSRRAPLYLRPRRSAMSGSGAHEVAASERSACWVSKWPWGSHSALRAARRPAASPNAALMRSTPSSPRKFGYVAPTDHGSISVRTARPRARLRSSSSAFSQSRSGWTMNFASRPASGECSGPNRPTAPPQDTMKIWAGPDGSSAARLTIRSIASSGRSTTFSAVQ